MKSIVLIALAGLGYSTLPIFSVALNDYGVGTWAQVLMRLVLMTVFLAIMTIRLRPTIDRRQRFFFFMNGFFIFAGFVTYLLSLELGTPPAKAILLVYIYPIFTILVGGFLLHEPMTPPKIVAVAVGVVGVALTFEFWKIESLTEFKSGDILALLNGILAGSIVLVGRYAHQHQPPFVTLLWSFIYALVWLTAVSIFFTVTAGLEEVLDAVTFSLSPASIFFLLGMVVCGTILPYLFLYTGLKHVPSGTASVLMLLEPVGVFVLSAIFLRQTIGLWQFIGGAAILGAGLIASARATAG